MTLTSYEPWPALPYNEFKSTAYLLHRGVQMIGKLKLYTPFEPHWANVILWLTSRGLTSGPIPYKGGVFSIDLDLINHQVILTTCWGTIGQFALETMSVAQLAQQLFSLLHQGEIDLKINLTPQEVPSPIPFDKDTEQCAYEHNLANAWWRILLSSYRVMQRYHAKFNGETPPIGLMWGTFDLRDARYNGQAIPATGINAGYIRRNAMDEAQVEVGWWHGNDDYQQPAYYSFTYPPPDKIELASIEPPAARWDKTLGEFILDYDAVRNSGNPDRDLLAFFESTYQAGSRSANWNPKLVTQGEPV